MRAPISTLIISRVCRTKSSISLSFLKTSVGPCRHITPRDRQHAWVRADLALLERSFYALNHADDASPLNTTRIAGLAAICARFWCMREESIPDTSRTVTPGNHHRTANGSATVHPHLRRGGGRSTCAGIQRECDFWWSQRTSDNHRRCGWRLRGACRSILHWPRRRLGKAG